MVYRSKMLLLSLKSISLDKYSEFIISLDKTKQIRNGFDGNKAKITDQNFTELSDALTELE